MSDRKKTYTYTGNAWAKYLSKFCRVWEMRISFMTAKICILKEELPISKVNHCGVLGSIASILFLGLLVLRNSRTQSGSWLYTYSSIYLTIIENFHDNVPSKVRPFSLQTSSKNSLGNNRDQFRRDFCVCSSSNFCNCSFWAILW